MPTETLDLVLPDWGALDTVLRSPLPFALWTIGDQCLLHHWLDHAVNQEITTVRIFAIDRPSAVRRVLDESTLWPITTGLTVISSVSEAPEGSILVGWLPGEEALAPPATGWDLIDRAAAIEKLWLQKLGADPDFKLYSVGFSCRIHPDATLIPPYFIGDHVLIGPNCEIGPNAVIGTGSVISGANRVSDSHLSPHSFLGPVTALENCRLESGTLLNLKHQARIDDIEPHLLSSLEKSNNTVPFSDRLKALVLYWKLGAPGPSAKSFETFDGRTLPGDPDAGLTNRAAWLPLVWKGRIPLYGVLPRSQKQFDALSPDWQNVIRHTPVGVFSYADSQGVHSTSHSDEAGHAVYQASLPPETLIASLRKFTRNLKSADLIPSSNS